LLRINFLRSKGWAKIRLVDFEMIRTQEQIPEKDNKIIIRWLAHHNPQREDFENHVFYVLNRAFCIGCFSFVFGVTIALIIGNLFYYQILIFLSLPSVLIIFFSCWIPSILQYLAQIVNNTPLKNRMIKFIIRFLYPMGSIILIFRYPLLGFAMAIPAGYFIVYIRKIKNKKLSES
jgi:hypothetical protein